MIFSNNIDINIPGNIVFCNLDKRILQLRATKWPLLIRWMMPDIDISVLTNGQLLLFMDILLLKQIKQTFSILPFLHPFQFLAENSWSTKFLTCFSIWYICTCFKYIQQNLKMCTSKVLKGKRVFHFFNKRVHWTSWKLHDTKLSF